MVKFDFDDDFVVFIIGFGVGGGILCNELCQKGIKVVVLEVGVMQSNVSFINDEWKFFFQFVWLDLCIISGSWCVVKDFLGLLVWICKIVGGMIIYWVGVLLWLQEYEFKIKIIYGGLVGVNLMDWLVMFKELEFYYVWVEDKMGVICINGILGLFGNNNFKVMYVGVIKFGYKEVYIGNMVINSQLCDDCGCCM